MQIVILGNGFDLASGLPTSYNDFFKWRFSKLKNQYEGVEKELDIYIDYLQIIPELIVNNSVIEKSPCYYRKINTDAGTKTYMDIYNELVMIMKKMINRKINFFDLHFWFNKKENATWSQIETEIFNIVVKNIVKYNIDNSLNKIERTLLINKKYTWEGNFFEKDEIYNLFLLIYLDQRKKESNLSIYELLLNELKDFESEFQDYINGICLKIRDNKDYINIYTKNFEKVTETENVNDIFVPYIINFNYTSIVQNFAKYHRIPIEVNVHGRYDKVTIFGIDQRECDVDKGEYIFSKTYRKISENTMSMSLPQRMDDSNVRQELIFYGHSLASADYSYFQSIFDLYDIYNQTKLIFKYSIYDPNKEREIKKEVFHKVTSLLVNYGKTMSNKDHGKNLLHKILLEGRLQLEEIILDKMKFE